MSLFVPRFNELSPIFRLADELDRASRNGPFGNSLQGSTRSFAPRFDIKETKDAYELHGELPGIDQSDVNIEWTDDNTISISGHTEKTYESKSDEGVESKAKSHQPTVEEEGKESANSGESNTVAKRDNRTDIEKADTDRPRFWVSERSYGSFHRTFQLPSLVDHENVKASLKDGILKIVVPKAKAREPRKIQLQ
jgi:HSP20 family protein